MDLVDVIRRLGWSATWAELRSVATERQIRAAVECGQIVRVGRGRYALPRTLDAGTTAAIRVNGTVSHLSAALQLGIAVRSAPRKPTVTVPRTRRLSASRRRGTTIYWADLDADDIVAGVTTAARTVVDCAVRLPLAEALVVADSALARRLVGRTELEARALRLPKQVRGRAASVIALADGRAQSPFESLVRGLSIGIPGLDLEPQVPVGRVHPDLWDRRLRMAVECDSFEHHAKREDLVSDCERYNDYALADAMLIRFAWEHSMHREEYIRETLIRAVAVRERQLGLR